MDKGIVQIVTSIPGNAAKALSRVVDSLGYTSSLFTLDEWSNDHALHLSQTPRLLLLDDHTSTIEIAPLRLKLGLFHVVLGSQSVLERCPTAGLMGADFCFFPCSEAELDFRLHRSCALLQPSANIDTNGHTRLITNMLGSAPVFVDTLAKIKRYGTINASTLITGETGTGKELAARAIHYSGISKEGPFQALNCGAIPDHLVENELFGHVKGAYTDAGSAQKGLVELAAGGTLFLDEVDALSARAQGALLRFLQDGSYRELGSGVEKQAKLRVLSATNQNLEYLSEQGLFRKDLFYRLNTLSLVLPSLKDRADDIPLLANHFVKQCAKQFELGDKMFHPIALTKMKNYIWPGNVRELENFVQRVYLDCNSSMITWGPMDEYFAGTYEPASGVGGHQSTDETSQYELSFVEAKRLAVEQFESKYVVNLLKETHGNVSKAARIAGKERRCFGKLIKKYHIDRDVYA